MQEKDNLNLTQEIAEMREMMRISREIRVPAMIYGGSLLGWYRQCNHLVESSDVDVAVLADEYKIEFFQQLFRSQVLNLATRYGTFASGLKFRAHTRADELFCIDLFLFYGTNSSQLSVYSLNDMDFLRNDYPLRKGVCSAEVHSVLVNLPCNYADFVIASYEPGDGWFVPDNGTVLPEINYEIIKAYNESDFLLIKYEYQSFNCSTPSEMWGCEEMPPDVVHHRIRMGFSDRIG